MKLHGWKKPRKNDAQLASIVTVSPESDLTVLLKRQSVVLAVMMSFFGFSVEPLIANRVIATIAALSASVAIFALGMLRNKIVLTLAKRGFAFLYSFQKQMKRILWMSGILIFTFVIAQAFVPATFALVGLAYVPFLTSLGYYVPEGTIFDSKWKEGKLSLQQFLKGKESGYPDYDWLRRGLSKVELRLAERSLSVPHQRLFFGCSYAIFKGSDLDQKLVQLGEWVVTPDEVDVRFLIPELLKLAKKAEGLKLEATPTPRESLARLPWTPIGIVLAAIGLLIQLVRLLLQRGG